MDVREEAQRFEYVLAGLCKDVREERIKCPPPERLTAALKTLFEKDVVNKFIPDGTLIAVREGRDAHHYVELQQGPLPPLNRIDVVWLKRRLTRYIED